MFCIECLLKWNKYNNNTNKTIAVNHTSSHTHTRRVPIRNILCCFFVCVALSKFDCLANHPVGYHCCFLLSSTFLWFVGAESMKSKTYLNVYIIEKAKTTTMKQQQQSNGLFSAWWTNERDEDKTRRKKHEKIIRHNCINTSGVSTQATSEWFLMQKTQTRTHTTCDHQ